MIDSHVHFWSASTDIPAWARSERARELIGIDREPADLLEEAAAVGVDGFVLVQSANSKSETDSNLAVAREHDGIKGVVGWMPLDNPAETAKALDALDADDSFKGVRHTLAVEPDPEWLTRPRVLEGLGLLAERGIVFETMPFTDAHHAQILKIFERVPDLRVALNHLGNPPLVTGGWEPWGAFMAEAGTYPGAFVKLSMPFAVVQAMERFPTHLVRPYSDVVLSTFGPERVMFGSQWPVVLVGADYPTTVNETRSLLTGIDADGLDDVLGLTAERCYGLTRSN